MTDWYYHAPGQGRVGPLSAEQMRQCYRERRITRETLAWHEGMREWQPVERMIEELGLLGVQPDLSLPPPPPPPPRPTAAAHTGPARSAAASPPPNRSGCIIAIVVLGIVGLVVLAILAAIALPAYQDYVKRAKAAQAGQPGGGAPTEQPAQIAPAPSHPDSFDPERMAETDALARELVTAAMREFYTANGNVCPDNLEFDKMMVRHPRFQGSAENGWFNLTPARPVSGACAYRVSFYGLGPEVRDSTVQYDVGLIGDEATVSCRNIDLPSGFVPPHCGA